MRRAKRVVKKRRRIPKIFRLPGWRIKILRVLPEDIHQVNSCRQCGNHDGDPAEGTWDVDTLTIWIDKTKSYKRQWEIFIHELDHAWNDWKHWQRVTA